MKKIIFTLIILFVALSAAAEFRCGPTAGINVSKFHWKQDLVTTTQLCGPNAGLIGELMIPGIGFGIDFSLLYSSRGSKVNFAEREIWASSGIENQNILIHTLQIPINLRFKWTRMNGFEQYVAPFAYAGPVFSFNLATTKCEAIEHPAGSIGLQCGVGGEFFEHLQLSAGYYWDLSYALRTVKLENFSARPQGWLVNVAWLF